jgi:DNA-binding MarR family transcriptional regulator
MDASAKQAVTVPAESQRIRQLLHRRDMAAGLHRAAVARRMRLSDTEMLVVSHLAQHGELGQVQLASLLELSSGGTAALLQRMERTGHVVRRGSDHDRRQRFVRLSPATLERLAEHYAPLVADVDTILAESPEAAAVIVDTLDRIAAATETHAERLRRRAAAETGGTDLTPALWG